MNLVGRKLEKEQISEAIHSSKAELGIVYGRRRVGKSALLESLIEKKRDLYFEGVRGLSKTDQIDHFLKQLSEQTDGLAFKAENWNQAFDILTKYISNGKRYIVFDEFPWMASERQELVAILKFYWDRVWKKNPKITLVLCGSVAQFMVKHVLHSEALHNRKTFEMKIEPLPAHEAKAFFKGYRSEREMAQFLMFFGGIPKYLEQINPKESLSININRLCLKKNSFFLQEFETLFKEQFKSTKVYEEIVAKLAQGALSKEKIAKSLKQKDGGGFKGYLDNLVRADFIKDFHPAGKESAKTIKYHLWDEWIRVYFYFIKKNLTALKENDRQDLFSSIIEKKSATFFGLTFEKLCLKNIATILDHLHIPLNEVLDYGPYFKQGSRSSKNKQDPDGLQIDILIVRKRNVLTLVECKFTESPVGVDVISEVEKKVKLLSRASQYTVEKVLISAAGVTETVENAEYFNKILGLECVFSKIGAK